MAVRDIRIVMRGNYDALLMDYAAGTLDEAHRMIVAAHIALSQDAQRRVAECECIGGALLEAICEPVAMREDALTRVLSQLDRAMTPPAPKPACANRTLPQALRHYIRSEDVCWIPLQTGVDICELSVTCPQSRARLLRLAPGVRMLARPRGSVEIILILEGALEDGAHTHGRGELIAMDEHLNGYELTAGRPSGCVCVSVTTARTRLHGWLKLFGFQR